MIRLFSKFIRIAGYLYFVCLEKWNSSINSTLGRLCLLIRTKASKTSIILVVETPNILAIDAYVALYGFNLFKIDIMATLVKDQFS